MSLLLLQIDELIGDLHSELVSPSINKIKEAISDLRDIKKAAEDVEGLVRRSLPHLYWASTHGSRCDELLRDAEAAVDMTPPESYGKPDPVAAERQRIRDILWKTPMPADWSENDQRRVTWMVAEFDKLICGIAE